MFITGKHLPRRTFVRGMGATLALPFLDAMIPAGRSFDGAALNKTRLICIEESHGSAGASPWGMGQNLFAPAQLGRDFEIHSTSHLASLSPYQEYLTVVSDTDCKMAQAFAAPEIGGDHYRSSAVFLTQSHPKQTQGSDIYAGISIDQLHARRFGMDTPIPSLQLCIEPLDQSGGCWYNYSCAYTNSISWVSPTEPLPMTRNPRAAFDQVFGAGGSDQERATRRRTNSSILDWMVQEIGTLRSSVNSLDQQRMDGYLENIREVERRIASVEAFNKSGEKRELPEVPSAVPDSFSEHVHLLLDISALALETDMTRVVSFKSGRDNLSRIFAESGTNTPWHGASHFGNSPEKILDFNTIQRYRLGTIAPFVERLKNTMEGDKNLLEKSVVLWGSPMSNPNVHEHTRNPLVLIGHGNGALNGNLHLKAPLGTPMANAFVSLLHGLGHDDVSSFGDSTGELPLTSPDPTVTAASQGSL